MEPRNDLSADFVRSILNYDQDTGIFTWKQRADIRKRNWNTRFAGQEAGTVKTNKDGKQYRQIVICYRIYRAHRLAWLYVTGEWPNAEIDHRDLDGTNNRFANLRPATRGENGMNKGACRDNTSGFKGVSWHRKRALWQATIQVAGCRHHLGFFDTPEAAHAVYCEAAQRLHGEFARVG